jgi:hypothetical protein
MTADNAPQVKDLPIGLAGSGTRTETDSIGEIKVIAGPHSVAVGLFPRLTAPAGRRR